MIPLKNFYGKENDERAGTRSGLCRDLSLIFPHELFTHLFSALLWGYVVEESEHRKASIDTVNRFIYIHMYCLRIYHVRAALHGQPFIMIRATTELSYLAFWFL